MVYQARRQTVRPAAAAANPMEWIRQNLFNSWCNSLLTLVSLGLVGAVVLSVGQWVFYAARWEVIPANLTTFLVGTYPRDQLWRIWTIVGLVTALSGLSAGAFGRGSFRFAFKLSAVGVLLALLPMNPGTRGLILFNVLLVAGGFLLARNRHTWRRWLTGLWILSFPLAMLLLWGFSASTVLPRVETTSWGGLSLTLLLALVGIVFSFPLGVLLALGRRSSLPVVSFLCTTFIEVIRGMPLVTILFMAHLMVPIFLPQVRIDKVVRAMIGLTVFTSAYMAENVRGGLQSVPRGQYEAAEALGLNATLTMGLVVLPQALRAVIPSIVGQFISLFKDTSLVSIIGLLELLGIARSVISNPDWLGLQPEVYLFAAALYWIFSFSLSQSSHRLETALGITRQ